MRRIVLRYHKGLMCWALVLGLTLKASRRPPTSAQRWSPAATKGSLASQLVFLILALADSAQCLAQQENWNLYGQSTYIYFRKDTFSAPYTNLNGSPNSLLPDRERSWTFTATAYAGVRLWDGGELYFVPEVVAQLPLSGLRGFGGSFQNGELQKQSERTPTFYRSRLFVRQMWNLGGEAQAVPSGPMQLSSTAESRRLVVTAGNVSILDIFDKNAFAGDIRQQFMNWDFMTHAAYDYAADARGYTWGVAAEYYYDYWAFRAGRFIGPRDPNQLQLNYSIMNYHGDNFELEHGHKAFGQSGKVRVLFYRNVARTGSFDDAVAPIGGRQPGPR